MYIENRTHLTHEDRIPRVYVNDSTWFNRSIDVFRGVFRGDEIIMKGSKLVHSPHDVSLTSVSPWFL